MNLTLAIAVYANVCKALGLPLSFPGKPRAYTALTNAPMPHFWQRRSSGWRPIRNAPVRPSTSPTVISSGGRTCGPSSAPSDE